MRKILSVLLSISFFACSDAPFTVQGVAGDYALSSVNGISLPIDQTGTDDDGNSFTVSFSEGTLQLTAEETWVLTNVLTFENDDNTFENTESSSGRYQLFGEGTLQFFDDDVGDTFFGTWKDGRLTVTDGDQILIYVR